MEHQEHRFKEQTSDDDLVDVVRDVAEADIMKRPADKLAGKHKAVSKLTGGMISVASNDVTIWQGVAQLAHDIDPVDLAHELEFLEMAGQKVPVIARQFDVGKVEAIGKVYLVEAIRIYNEKHPDAPLDVVVSIQECDDARAYRIVAQELEAGPTVSSLERGLFYQRAIDVFGSEANVARECRVPKGTVSKNLDVARAIPVVGRKVLIPRDIAQRDAMWLMSIVGRRQNGADAPDPEKRAKLLAAIDAVDLGHAKMIFRALKATLKENKPKKGLAHLEHRGKDIGTIRRAGKEGPIRIDLIDSGDVMLDDLVAVLREAIEDADARHDLIVGDMNAGGAVSHGKPPLPFLPASHESGTSAASKRTGISSLEGVRYGARDNVFCFFRGGGQNDMAPYLTSRRSERWA